VRVGVESFDVSYGTSLRTPERDVQAIECPIVEDGGEFRIHPARRGERPSDLAFVDGVMQTEAHLTWTTSGGEITGGIAGAWGAGAVLVAKHGRPALIERVETGRAAIFTHGRKVQLDPNPAGWQWEARSVESEGQEKGRPHRQRIMRDAEAEIAERLLSEGWVTVIDGPLRSIRRNWHLPVVGYVKTHHRRTLAAEHWRKIPGLGVGERSSLFAMKDDIYGCYIRMGDPGPWAGPWSGIARIEVPASAGRRKGTETVGRVAGWLPAFASAAHRNPRAPVNLVPVAALEKHLHRMLGDSRLALHAVREAAINFNRNVKS